MRMAQTEEAQRTLIKNAILLHKYKGTEWAIIQALQSIGFTDIRLKKGLADGYDHWAKFGIEITNTSLVLTSQNMQDIYSVINEYKRAVCILMDVSMTTQVTDTLTITDKVTIVPNYQIQDDLSLTGDLKYNGAAEHNGEHSYSGESDVVTITLSNTTQPITVQDSTQYSDTVTVTLINTIVAQPITVVQGSTQFWDDANTLLAGINSAYGMQFDINVPPEYDFINVDTPGFPVLGYIYFSLTNQPSEITMSNNNTYIRFGIPLSLGNSSGSLTWNGLPVSGTATGCKYNLLSTTNSDGSTDITVILYDLHGLNLPLQLSAASGLSINAYAYSDVAQDWVWGNGSVLLTT